MAIFDLFSKRQRRLRGEVPDVYIYDEIPDALRAQVVHIWLDALGGKDNYWQGQVREAYEFICDSLCREYGIFRLPPAKDYGDRNFAEELINFLLNESVTERLLDAIELSFKVIDRFTREHRYLNRNNCGEVADNAINELNVRFREHGIGYQFVEGEIVRVDSELMHQEAVKPALSVLRRKEFAGAQEEFLKAHEHYRHGNNKEALNECLKCFESVMKSICDKHKWSYAPNATAKQLLQACFDNGLIPAFWQSHYSSLRSLLESGVPTGRNKLGGHGQGASPTNVPPHLVAYMLHMTASAVLFLSEAEANVP
ncbi:STM4504/CBY_0614 family protein [Dyella sp. A6]|uniref:STM4504/CBY_0614 family protein n=1 Tax=Dyella aluminiiresistens TaxID=3069105 RepID=UPI002E790BF6|nr:hypothetical protein [Dyella sp. A6]